MKRMIRPYYRVLINSLSVSLTYRWNVLAGVATQLVALLTSVFVWKYVFAGQTSIQNYTFKDMVTYLVLTSLLGVTFSSAHMFRLSQLVRKGTLSTFLLRPYSFLGDSFAIFIGSKITDLAATGAVAAALLPFGVVHFSHPSWLAVLLVVSNFVLLFCFGSLIGALSFWMIQMWPMKPLFNALMALVGGVVFPLDLLPATIHRVLELTPFSLFGFANARALQGALSHAEAVRYLYASLGWSALCLIMYAILWRRGLKRYEGVNA